MMKLIAPLQKLQTPSKTINWRLSITLQKHYV